MKTLIKMCMSKYVFLVKYLVTNQTIYFEQMYTKLLNHVDIGY